MPPASWAYLEDLVGELVLNLSSCLHSGRPLYVATDGGSKDDVGSFAIHFEGQSHGAGTGHEDQSAFRQELNALLFLEVLENDCG